MSRGFPKITSNVVDILEDVENTGNDLWKSALEARKHRLISQNLHERRKIEERRRKCPFGNVSVRKETSHRLHEGQLPSSRHKNFVDIPDSTSSNNGEEKFNNGPDSKIIESVGDERLAPADTVKGLADVRKVIPRLDCLSASSRTRKIFNNIIRPRSNQDNHVWRDDCDVTYDLPFHLRRIRIKQAGDVLESCYLDDVDLDKCQESEVSQSQEIIPEGEQRRTSKQKKNITKTVSDVNADSMAATTSTSSSVLATNDVAPTAEGRKTSVANDLNDTSKKSSNTQMPEAAVSFFSAKNIKKRLRDTVESFDDGVQSKKTASFADALQSAPKTSPLLKKSSTTRKDPSQSNCRSDARMKVRHELRKTKFLEVGSNSAPQVDDIVTMKDPRLRKKFLSEEKRQESIAMRAKNSNIAMVNNAKGQFRATAPSTWMPSWDESRQPGCTAGTSNNSVVVEDVQVSHSWLHSKQQTPTDDTRTGCEMQDKRQKRQSTSEDTVSRAETGESLDILHRIKDKSMFATARAILGRRSSVPNELVSEAEASGSENEGTTMFMERGCARRADVDMRIGLRDAMGDSNISSTSVLSNRMSESRERTDVSFPKNNSNDAALTQKSSTSIIDVQVANEPSIVSSDDTVTQAPTIISQKLQYVAGILNAVGLTVKMEPAEEEGVGHVPRPTPKESEDVPPLPTLVHNTARIVENAHVMHTTRVSMNTAAVSVEPRTTKMTPKESVDATHLSRRIRSNTMECVKSPSTSKTQATPMIDSHLQAKTKPSKCLNFWPMAMKTVYVPPTSKKPDQGPRTPDANIRLIPLEVEPTMLGELVDPRLKRETVWPKTAVVPKQNMCVPSTSRETVLASDRQSKTAQILFKPVNTVYPSPNSERPIEKRLNSQASVYVPPSYRKTGEPTKVATVRVTPMQFNHHSPTSEKSVDGRGKGLVDCYIPPQLRSTGERAQVNPVQASPTCMKQVHTSDMSKEQIQNSPASKKAISIPPTLRTVSSPTSKTDNTTEHALCSAAPTPNESIDTPPAEEPLIINKFDAVLQGEPVIQKNVASALFESILKKGLLRRVDSTDQPGISKSAESVVPSSSTEQVVQETLVAPTKQQAAPSITTPVLDSTWTSLLRPPPIPPLGPPPTSIQQLVPPPTIQQVRPPPCMLHLVPPPPIQQLLPPPNIHQSVAPPSIQQLVPPPTTPQFVAPTTKQQVDPSKTQPVVQSITKHFVAPSTDSVMRPPFNPMVPPPTIQKLMVPLTQPGTITVVPPYTTKPEPTIAKSSAPSTTVTIAKSSAPSTTVTIAKYSAPSTTVTIAKYSAPSTTVTIAKASAPSTTVTPQKPATKQVMSPSSKVKRKRRRKRKVSARTQSATPTKNNVVSPTAKPVTPPTRKPVVPPSEKLVAPPRCKEDLEEGEIATSSDEDGEIKVSEIPNVRESTESAISSLTTDLDGVLPELSINERLGTTNVEQTEKQLKVPDSVVEPTPTSEKSTMRIKQRCYSTTTLLSSEISPKKQTVSIDDDVIVLSSDSETRNVISPVSDSQAKKRRRRRRKRHYSEEKKVKIRANVILENISDDKGLEDISDQEDDDVVILEDRGNKDDVIEIGLSPEEKPAEVVETSQITTATTLEQTPSEIAANLASEIDRELETAYDTASREAEVAIANDVTDLERSADAVVERSEQRMCQDIVDTRVEEGLETEEECSLEIDLRLIDSVGSADANMQETERFYDACKGDSGVIGMTAGDVERRREVVVDSVNKTVEKPNQGITDACTAISTQDIGDGTDTGTEKRTLDVSCGGDTCTERRTLSVGDGADTCTGRIEDDRYSGGSMMNVCESRESVLESRRPDARISGDSDMDMVTEYTNDNHSEVGDSEEIDLNEMIFLEEDASSPENSLQGSSMDLSAKVCDESEPPSKRARVEDEQSRLPTDFSAFRNQENFYEDAWPQIKEASLISDLVNVMSEPFPLEGSDVSTINDVTAESQMNDNKYHERNFRLTAQEKELREQNLLPVWSESLQFTRKIEWPFSTMAGLWWPVVQPTDGVGTSVPHERRTGADTINQLPCHTHYAYAKKRLLLCDVEPNAHLKRFEAAQTARARPNEEHFQRFKNRVSYLPTFVRSDVNEARKQQKEDRDREKEHFQWPYQDRSNISNHIRYNLVDRFSSRNYGRGIGQRPPLQVLSYWIQEELHQYVPTNDRRTYICQLVNERQKSVHDCIFEYSRVKPNFDYYYQMQHAAINAIFGYQNGDFSSHCQIWRQPKETHPYKLPFNTRLFHLERRDRELTHYLKANEVVSLDELQRLLHFEKFEYCYWPLVYDSLASSFQFIHPVYQLMDLYRPWVERAMYTVAQVEGRCQIYELYMRGKESYIKGKMEDRMIEEERRREECLREERQRDERRRSVELMVFSSIAGNTDVPMSYSDYPYPSMSPGAGWMVSPTRAEHRVDQFHPQIQRSRSMNMLWQQEPDERTRYMYSPPPAPVQPPPPQAMHDRRRRFS